MECSISQFEMSKHVSKSHIQKYFNHSLKNSKQILSIFTPLIIIQRIKPVKELVLVRLFQAFAFIILLYPLRSEVSSTDAFVFVTIIFFILLSSSFSSRNLYSFVIRSQVQQLLQKNLELVSIKKLATLRRQNYLKIFLVP